MASSVGCATSESEAIARFEQRYERDASRLLTDVEVVVADEPLFVGKPQHCLFEPAY
jgi:hypothetical protein